MRIRSALLAPAVVGFATACIPPRDNPNDSAIKPVAKLSVYDQTLASGECPDPPIAVTTGIVVEEASRGRCLALDATASSDPQGESGLRYEFSLRTSAEQEWEPLGENDVGIFPLSTLERRRHPAPLTLDYRVRVVDPQGAHDTAVVEFELQNERPVARLGPHRVFPIGGHSWDDGSEPCYDVPFDASGTTDPDGDEPFLSYAWSFVPPQDPECGTAMSTTGATITLRVPKSRFGRTVATVVAHDGLVPSLPVNVTVGVRQAEVMEVFHRVVDGDTAVGVSRIDSSFERITTPTRLSVSATRVGPGELIALAWEDAGSHYIGRIDPADIEDVLDGPAPFVDLLNTLIIGNRIEEDAVWVVQLGEAFTPGDEFASVWNLDGTPAISTPANVSIESWVLPEATLFEVDSGFNLWVSQLAFGDVLGIVERATGNTIDVRTPNPARAIGGLAARPGTSGEVWITEVSNIFGNGDGGAPRLMRYRSDLSFDAYELPSAYATGIGWIDESRLWLGIPGEGAWLVDASLLPEGVADAPLPDDAVLLRVPLTGDPFFVFADPVSGSAILGLIDGRGVEIALDGAASYLRGAPAFRFTQEDGRRWFQQGSALYRGFAMNPSGSYGTVLRPGGIGVSNQPVRDVRIGGFWLAGSFGGLQRFSPDGILLEEVFTVFDADQGASRSIPVLRQQLIGEPDGNHLWAFLSHLENGQEVLDELLRIDVTTSPFTSTAVLDATDGPAMFGTQDAKDANFFGTDAFLALSDPGAPEPFAWVAHVVGQTVSIGTLDIEGNREDRFTFPSGEFAAFYRPRGQRVPGSNRLCVGVGDVGGGTPMVHIRMLDPIAPDAVVMEIHQALSADDRLSGVVATREADGTEVCWFQLSDPAGDCDGSKPGVHRVRGYRPDGAGGGILVASLDDTVNDGFRLTRGGIGSFWFESRRCDEIGPFGSRSPHKVEIQRSEGTLVETKVFESAGFFIESLIPDD